MEHLFQSNPIAALVEKVTNSMDAILMRKCIELGIDPKSKDAPRSMDEAVDKFFPKNNWDLATFRRKQSEDIEIVADGPTRESAVIIYDNGEGQRPKNFQNTFLSLVSGNKKKPRTKWARACEYPLHSFKIFATWKCLSASSIKTG